MINEANTRLRPKPKRHSAVPLKPKKIQAIDRMFEEKPLRAHICIFLIYFIRFPRVFICK